jgi:amino acid permease
MKKQVAKLVDMNQPKRTRFKLTTAVFIVTTLTLIFFSWMAYKQFTNTGDVSLGIGSIIGGILAVLSAILQIYGAHETKRPSSTTIVQNQITPIPPDFEDEGDDEPIPLDVK